MNAEDNLWESFLSLQHVGPGPQTGLQAWPQALLPAEPSRWPSHSTIHFRACFSHRNCVLFLKTSTEPKCKLYYNILNI